MIMVHIVIVLSKYVLILLMGLIAIANYQVLLAPGPGRKNRLCRRIEVMIFYFQLFGNLDLILVQLTSGSILEKEENVSGAVTLLEFYAAQMIFILLVFLLYRRILKNTSRLITDDCIFFMTIGILMLTRLSYEKYARKQFITMVICFVLSMAVTVLFRRLKVLSRLSVFYGVTGFLLLASVLVLGVSQYGATNWISLGGLTLQPSEFAKIFFTLFVACRLSRELDVRNIVITTLCAGAYVIFLAAENDLGGALIFFMVYVIMLYAATGRSAVFITAMAGAALASVGAYRLLNHVRVRVRAFIDPWSMIDSGGSQICQSLMAIATGGWFGLGLAQGVPYYVPVVYSDFIVSALAEELGAIFVMCLIMIYISVFIEFLRVCLDNRRRFFKFISLGLGVCFIFQTFLNIGGAVKFIPLTGVTLPFISYGRSSVISVMIIFAIIQAGAMETVAPDNYDENEAASDVSVSEEYADEG